MQTFAILYADNIIVRGYIKSSITNYVSIRCNEFTKILRNKAVFTLLGLVQVYSKFYFK